MIVLARSVSGTLWALPFLVSVGGIVQNDRSASTSFHRIRTISPPRCAVSNRSLTTSATTGLIGQNGSSGSTAAFRPGAERSAVVGTCSRSRQICRISSSSRTRSRETSRAGGRIREAGLASSQSWSTPKLKSLRTSARVLFAMIPAPRSSMSSTSARTSRRVRSRTDRSPRTGNTFVLKMRSSSVADFLNFLACFRR